MSAQRANATLARARTGFLAGGGEMGARIRDFDWSATPLGPIQSWPQSLKTSVNLILSSRHPMWIGWGPEATFLYNDAYLHVLGPAKHPAALGRPAAEVWSEIWDVCGPLANKVFEKGEATFVDDVRLLMDRGEFLEETFYSFSYSPIRDERGAVGGLFCPSTDVTPKVVNARRLRTLSELATGAFTEKTTTGACALAARTLAGNSDDVPFALIYLIDPRGESASLEGSAGCLLADSAKPRHIDLTDPAADPGWGIAGVFRSSETRIVSAAWVSGTACDIAGQSIAQAVVLPISSHGEHRPYGVLVAGVNPCRPLDQEHLTFFELIAGQVAAAIQNARAVEEEKRRADMLAELDRAKTAFFSNVSHEFRTPLTLMLGPLENLMEKKSGLAQEEQEALAVAHRNSLRLLRLVNSLLDFSRIEAGRVRALFAPTDLSAFTADLASNFRSAIESAGLQFIVDCRPLPESVYVDREMWEKIVLNLLSNAFKFTFAGSIAIRLSAEAGQAVLTVTDTGIGIPEAELPRIFDRFHRIEGARGRTYEGTGIGLALIQELVKIHAGAIVVTSREGEGSTFRISLPFGTEHLNPAHIVNHASDLSSTAVREAFTGEALTWLSANGRDASAVGASNRSAALGKGRPRVLLADDNADMREHVSRILANEYDLAVANDGKQALDMLRENPPDLLLTDVMMPRLDGFGLLKAVRENPDTSTLPVIVVSARAGEDMQLEGLAAGADDYLVKPFTANELRARVRTHVQMALARRAATERERALRAEAEAARDQAISVLENITDGFLAMDRHWRITYVNAEAERLNSMRREDVVGRNYWDVYPDAVATTTYDEFHRAVAERTPVEFENYYTPWKRWFHVKAYPAADGGLSVFYEDITNRKNAENKLLGSERRFREVIDALPAAIFATDAGGRLTHCNPAAVKLAGRPLEPGVVEWWAGWKLYSADGKALSADEFPHALAESGNAPRTEYLAERADGSRVWLVPYGTVLRDADGQTIGSVTMLRDVSARKTAQQDLRLSEERFRGVFESSAIGVAILTTEARFVEANAAFCSMTGYSVEELRGSDCFRLTHPDDCAAMQKQIARLISGELNTFILENRSYSKSGAMLWLQNSVSAVRDQQGRTVRLIALSENVTDRKRIDLALRESEQRFRAIFDTTPQCVKVVDADGKVLQMNASGLAMIAAPSLDALAGKTVHDLVAPEFRESYRRFNERICSGEKGSLEFDIIDFLGRRHHMETYAAPLPTSDGRIFQLAIAHDVTERRRAERARLLLAAIIDSSDDAIISKDLNGVITSWNRSAQRLFGYTPEEAVGKTVAELLIPPDRQQEEPEILARLRRGERVDHFETARRCKDGTLIDLSLTISPVKDARGRVIGASKIARDITDRKRGDRAALLLSAIVESSDDAIISKDLNGVVTSWNKSAQRLFGYTAEEAIGRTIAELLIPEDRQSEEPEILGKLARGERVDHFETIRRCKNGSLRHISLTISPVRDARGQIIGASKIARDITDRKRAEEAIQQLNAQLTNELAAMSRMQQLSTRLVQAGDFGQLLEEIIDAAMEITGAEMGNIQLLEHGSLRIVSQHGFDPAFMDFFNSVHCGQAACGTALQNRERVIIEDVAQSPIFAGTPELDAMLAAGARAVQSTPLVSRSGRVLGIFSTHYRSRRRPGERELRLLDLLARQAADLIERKQAESELLASEARFRHLADAMPQMVWTAGPDGNIDYYNERWYAFTGFPPDSVGEAAWRSIIHPDDLTNCLETWYASVRTGEPYRVEVRFWDRAESRWRWFMGRALPVRGSSGDIVKWFGTSTDIDEQKSVEDELRSANDDLEQFAYSASHDLQEPVRGIKIYSQLLAKRLGADLTGDPAEFLKYLSESATRMEMLVRDLLAYTRVTRIDVPQESTNANEVLTHTLANLGGAIVESGARITSDPLPELLLNRTHLQQVLQNLIGNAIKYRSPERVPVIHVSAERQNQNWVFSVRDNGIGIDPEYKERIFGLFKRLHTGDEYAGTGIGLAICKRIVERYRGRIWLESEPGRGSTFFFTIPDRGGIGAEVASSPGGGRQQG